jgi:hypothetical protein
MIHHVASITMLPGQAKHAEQWLSKVAAFVTQKFPGTNSHILRNFAGKGHQIHIFETWASVGAWEAGNEQTEADPTWPALMQEAAGLFDENSFERHFYQVIAAA